MDDLRASIKTHGFNKAFPLFVRPSKVEPGKLELVAGERRFRCAGDLGVDQVPVIIQDLDDQAMFEFQLIENIQRESLTPVEEARAYVRMRDEFGYTIEKIADKVGLKSDTIAERIKLLRAPEVVLAALEDPEAGLGVSHAILIAGVPDAGQRAEFAKLVMMGQWDPQLQRNVPLTVARTKLLRREKFMVSLKECPWDPLDATLLPERGPCEGCQYLAKTFLAGTGELQTGNKGSSGVEPMTCCNPACYDDKKQAAWKRKCDEVKASGVKPLTKAEVKEVFWEDGRLRYDSPWVPVTSKPPSAITGIYDDHKAPSYEKILKTVDAKPERKLAQMKDGKFVEMVPRHAVENLAKQLKKKGELKREKVEVSDAEKKRKAKEAFENKVAQETKIQTLELTYQQILKKGIGLEEHRAILEMMLQHAGMDGMRLMADWLNVVPEKPTKKGENLNQGHYQAALMKSLEEAPMPHLAAMTVIAFMAKNVKQGWALDYFVKPVMKAFDIEHKAIRVAAESIVKAEEDAKKAKVKTKEAKPSAKEKKKALQGALETGDSGAVVRPVGSRTEPEEVYREGDESKEDIETDWQKQWDALPTKPKKGTPEFKLWDAKRKKIKYNAAKAGIELVAKLTRA